MEINECLACGKTKFSHVSDVKDHSISHENFKINECLNCGLRITQPMPPESKIGYYYKSEKYISHSDNKSGLINYLYHLVRNWMLAYKYRLCLSYGSGKTLLDVGSGTGYFPHFMKNKGFDVMGIEVDENARKFSQDKFGLDVRTPDDLLNKKIDKKFGFITLWHVLEHLYDPGRYLDVLLDTLEQEGTILIAVPNYGSFDGHYFQAFWAAYDVPRHLWHFTPLSMQKLVSKHGLKIVSKKAMPFDPFYNSLLSAGYRKESFPLWKGFWVGINSFITGAFQVDKASSIIYILKRI